MKSYDFPSCPLFQGKRPPYIAVAGDCSQAAYILRPIQEPMGSGSDFDSSTRGSRASEDSLSGGRGGGGEPWAPLAYEVACTIEVPGTVGSLAVGYGRIPGESLRAASFTFPEANRAEAETPSCNPVRAERSPHTIQVDNEAAPPTKFPVDSTVRGVEIPDERCLASGKGSDGGSDEGASGWAKIYIPNYDGNRVYVFSMGPSLIQ